MDHPTCPLCLRPIPPGARQSLHHLIPKLRGGKGGPTVLVHQICHNEVHAALTETELARDWNTPEKLRTHPALAPFFEWVRRRPPDFHAPSRRSLRRRRR
ncbi:MAG: HNH endonuclease [Hasllibacter sp.]